MAAGSADNDKIVVNDIPAVEIEEGRIDLAVGQVAAAPKRIITVGILFIIVPQKNQLLTILAIYRRKQSKTPQRNVLFV